MTNPVRNTRLPVLLHAAALLIVLLIPSLASPPAATAGWNDDGNFILGGPLADWPGHSPTLSVGTTVCTDGDGGLICACITAPFGNTIYEIRAQRLDGATGAQLWNSSTGISATGGLMTASGPPHVVSDRNRGAWVVWADDRGAAPGLYVQRFDSEGNPVFGANPSGKHIGADDIDSEGNSDLDVDVTNDGRLIIAYWDGGLRLQRLALDGTPEWGATGVAVTTDAGHHRLDVVVDGNGAVVAWESQRAGQPGPTSVFANRVNSSGVVQWGAEGSVVFSAPGVTPEITHAAWDGASLFVSWQQNRSVWYDIHAQKLNGSGVIQWGTSSTGITVLTAPDTPWDLSGTNSKPLPQIVSDGSGGCVIVWEDHRDYDRGTSPNFHREDIYGQRLNTSGVALWTANGEPLDDHLGRQFNVQVLPNGTNGVFIVYADYLDVDIDITARRIDPDGASVWWRWLTGYGDNGTQDYPVVANDDRAGLLAAWWDNGGSTIQCYGTHCDGEGLVFVPRYTITSPNGGEVLFADQVVPITWTSNLSGTVKLMYSKSDGAKINITYTTPDDGSYDWTVPNNPSTNVRVFVMDAVDWAPRDSSDAYFTICTAFGSTLSNYAANGSATDLAVLDANRDGILDLAVTNSQAGPINLTVLKGNGSGGVGDGTFSTLTHCSLGEAGGYLATGDFNEDGYADLAVTTGSGVRVLPGNAGGTFGLSQGPYPAGSNPRGIAAADFNEDGVTDLAVANSSSNNVSILLGNGTGGVGDGTFASPTNFATGMSPDRIAVGDFDEDGITDLAVTNNNAASNSVSILLGQGTGPVGNGAFGAAVNYAVGANPVGVVTGDFNEDGITDLAVANHNGPTVSILLGNGAGGVGNGTFAPQVAYTVGSRPRDLAAGDFDRNGITDLLVTDKSNDLIYLLCGDGAGGVGDGTFTVGTSYSVGDAPESVVASDFNEDGRPDFATANVNGDNVSVRLGGLCGAGLSASIWLANPGGGVTWSMGAEHTFSWARGAAIMAVNLELSRDGGLTWERVADNVTGTSHTWTVTGPPTATALARIYDSTVPGRLDASDATFVIQNSGVGVPPRGETVAGLAPARPNPFRDDVRLTLGVPRATRARVGVYDLAGRNVRTLLDGSVDPGEHVLLWDGRDASGSTVPGGIYFVRARWSGFEAVRRVVRIR